MLACYIITASIKITPPTLSWVATAAVGEGSELLVFAVEGRYSEPEACLGHFCSSRFAARGKAL